MQSATEACERQQAVDHEKQDAADDDGELHGGPDRDDARSDRSRPEATGGSSETMLKISHAWSFSPDDVLLLSGRAHRHKSIGRSS